MDNEPLSQQADSSPNKSGEQPEGQFSKLLPLQRGGGSESQRGKSKVLT